jgi:hypothetical protein
VHGSKYALLVAAFDGNVLVGASLFSRRHQWNMPGRFPNSPSDEDEDQERGAWLASGLSALYYYREVSVVETSFQNLGVANKLALLALSVMAVRQAGEGGGVGYYGTVLDTNVPALSGLLQSKCELWGRYQQGKVTKMGADEKTMKYLDMRRAVLDTRVEAVNRGAAGSEKHEGREEDYRIATIRKYCEMMNDSEYLVWTKTLNSQKHVEEARSLRAVREMAHNVQDTGRDVERLNVTFRPIHAPSEIAAALALVYATKVGAAGRITYDKPFVGLGAYIETVHTAGSPGIPTIHRQLIGAVIGVRSGESAGITVRDVFHHSLSMHKLCPQIVNRWRLGPSASLMRFVALWREGWGRCAANGANKHACPAAEDMISKE